MSKTILFEFLYVTATFSFNFKNSKKISETILLIFEVGDILYQKLKVLDVASAPVASS